MNYDRYTSFKNTTYTCIPDNHKIPNAQSVYITPLIIATSETVVTETMRN